MANTKVDLVRQTILILDKNQEIRAGDWVNDVQQSFVLHSPTRVDEVCRDSIDGFTKDHKTLHHANLTILVCVDAESDCKAIYSKIDASTGNPNLPVFNVIPVYQNEMVRDAKQEQLTKLRHARKPMIWSKYSNNTQAFVTEIKEASLCLSIHQALRDGDQVLMHYAVASVEYSRISSEIKKYQSSRTASELTSIFNNKFKESVWAVKEEASWFDYPKRAYFIHAKLYSLLVVAALSLANATCSLLNAVALFSVVGSYFAYQQFSHNYHKHGNPLKFFATNHMDRAQAIFYDAECALGAFSH